MFALDISVRPRHRRIESVGSQISERRRSLAEPLPFPLRFLSSEDPETNIDFPSEIALLRPTEISELRSGGAFLLILIVSEIP